jgi:hypothetical protein
MNRVTEIGIAVLSVGLMGWLLAMFTVAPMAENYRHHGNIFLAPEQLDSCGRKIASPAPE